MTTDGLSRPSRMIRAGSPRLDRVKSKSWMKRLVFLLEERGGSLSGMRLLPVSSFLCLFLSDSTPSCSLHHGYSLMFFIKLTLAVRGTLSPRCLHNIVYNSGCAEFHFILAGGPYTYRSLVCSLSSLFRPSPTLLSSRSNCLALSSRGVSRCSIPCTDLPCYSFVNSKRRERNIIWQKGGSVVVFHDTKRDTCEINLVIIDVDEPIRLLYMKYL